MDEGDDKSDAVEGDGESRDESDGDGRRKGPSSSSTTDHSTTAHSSTSGASKTKKKRHREEEDSKFVVGIVASSSSGDADSRDDRNTSGSTGDADGVDHVEEDDGGGGYDDDNDDIGDTSDTDTSAGMSLSGFSLGSLGRIHVSLEASYPDGKRRKGPSRSAKTTALFSSYASRRSQSIHRTLSHALGDDAENLKLLELSSTLSEGKMI
ncbi:hypothetical protein ACHAW5_006196, partial [Stephanodiscus triporus]